MTGEVKIISRTYRKIKGKYYARIRYQIDDGKPLDIMRQVENKSAIKSKHAEIEAELLKNGPAQLVAGKVTFRQLAQYAKDNIFVAAVYDDQETKIKGVRNVVPAHAALDNLVAFSGDIVIRKINEKNRCSLRQWTLEPEGPPCWITCAGKILTLLTRSSRSLHTKARAGTSSRSVGRCK